jgi:cohesin loading factor subunit SCC2
LHISFLKVEEGAAKEMEIHMLPYIVALQAFCIVDPTLCIPVTDPSKFVVTLQPYLNIQVSMVCISPSLGCHLL